jgi:hypothetical protein
MEPKSSYMVGKGSASELHPQPSESVFLTLCFYPQTHHRTYDAENISEVNVNWIFVEDAKCSHSFILIREVSCGKLKFRESKILKGKWVHKT